MHIKYDKMQYIISLGTATRHSQESGYGAVKNTNITTEYSLTVFQRITNSSEIPIRCEQCLVYEQIEQMDKILGHKAAYSYKTN